MKRWSVLLPGLLVLSACGSGANLKAAQNNKNVQQTEAKVEQQVSRCLPTAHGAPDPLGLARRSARTKFATCTGVVKRGGVFEKCALKVILGGIPTVGRVEKGLTACVEQSA